MTAGFGPGLDIGQIFEGDMLKVVNSHGERPFVVSLFPDLYLIFTVRKGLYAPLWPGERGPPLADAFPDSGAGFSWGKVSFSPNIAPIKSERPFRFLPSFLKYTKKYLSFAAR